VETTVDAKQPTPSGYAVDRGADRAGTEASADDGCGGVLMATRTTAMKDRKELVQKLGFYKIDGGLVMNGESTCTSIVIECLKANHTCRTATATTNSLVAQAQVIGMFMSDDFKVTEWSNDTISAELHTPVGGTSYLHIAINDDTPDKAEVINITKSFIDKAGKWITEVLTVANDPALDNFYARNVEHATHRIVPCLTITSRSVGLLAQSARTKNDGGARLLGSSGVA
jgi:hypothetical protein